MNDLTFNELLNTNGGGFLGAIAGAVCGFDVGLVVGLVAVAAGANENDALGSAFAGAALGFWAGAVAPTP